MFANPVAFGQTGNAQVILEAFRADQEAQRTEMARREAERRYAQQLFKNDLTGDRMGMERDRLAIAQQKAGREQTAWDQEQQRQQAMLPFARDLLKSLADIPGDQNPGAQPGATPDVAHAQPMPQMPANLAGQAQGPGMMAGMEYQGPSPSPFAQPTSLSDELRSRFQIRKDLTPYQQRVNTLAQNGDYRAVMSAVQFLQDEKMRRLAPGAYEASLSSNGVPRSAMPPALRQFLEALESHGSAKSIEDLSKAAIENMSRQAQMQQQGQNAIEVAKARASMRTPTRLEHLMNLPQDQVEQWLTDLDSHDPAIAAAARANLVRNSVPVGAPKRAASLKERVLNDPELFEMAVNDQLAADPSLKGDREKAAGIVRRKAMGFENQDPSRLASQNKVRINPATKARLESSIQQAKDRLSAVSERYKRATSDKARKAMEQEFHDAEADVNMAQTALQEYMQSVEGQSGDEGSKYRDDAGVGMLTDRMPVANLSKPTESALDDKTRDAIDAAIDDLLKKGK